MDRQAAVDILSGRRRGVGASLARVGLAVAAGPYALVMRIRRWAYRRGLLPSRAAPVPVICVGNLTTGGTGKTPMVAWIVRHLAAIGRRPAILTRGYKAVAGRSDEAELLRRLCGVEVIVDADRVAGAAAAAAAGCDVCVMDDGFQHRRLRRGLDVVLIDAAEPFGYGRCLPRGLLREPVAALRDAGAVVITRSDRVPAEQVEQLGLRLGRLAPGAAIAAGVHRPIRVIDENGAELPLDALAGRKVLAFCGVAQPESFFATLEGLGAQLVDRLALDDHVHYSPGVLGRVAEAAGRSDAEVLLTTQKDGVKLAGAALPGRLWALAVEMDVVEGREALLERIERALDGP